MAKGSPSKKAAQKPKNVFEIFQEGRTYRNIVYLLILLPLGMISFMAIAILFVLSFGFIVMPLLAPFGPINLGGAQITSLPIKLAVSLLFMILGIGILTLSLHITNWAADIYRRLLKALD